MRWIVAVALSLVMVLVVGCARVNQADSGDLTVLRAFYTGVSAEDDQLAAAYLVREDQLIAECLREYGFDRPDTTAIASVPLRPGERLDPESYARRYGFGITTVADELLDLESQRRSLRDAFPSGLSPDGERMYSEAMVECSSAAAVELQAAAPPQEFFAGVALLEAEALDDIRATEAASRWSVCMADRGWEFAAPEALRDWIVEQATSMREDTKGFADLQTLERDVAVASLACDGGYAAAVRTVLAELEAGFVVEHGSELTGVRESLGL